MPLTWILKGLSIQIHNLLGVRDTKRLKHSRGGLLHPAALSEPSLRCVFGSVEVKRTSPQVTAWSSTRSLYLGARRCGLNSESATHQPVSVTSNRFFVLRALAWVLPVNEEGGVPHSVVHLTTVPEHLLCARHSVIQQ